MWRTNVKVGLVGLVVIGFYTTIAHIIPQLESEVPSSLDLSGATPEALVSAGDQLFHGAGGCTACHGLGTRAPNLLTDHAGEGPIGSRCGTRESGVDCKSYLYESLTDPHKVLVSGFEPIMPDISRQLDNDQLWALVAYLESNGGTVDVTGADIQRTATASAAPAGGAPAGPVAGGSTDPQQLLNANACLGCHMLGGSGGAVGPSFDGIGGRLSADQIREAILDPGATTAKGFEAMAGVMPTTFGSQLTAAQLEAIVGFLSRQR